VPPGAKAIACNLTVTGGTSGGNLRAFPGNSDVIPLVSNVNWTAGQTVANYAIVGAATPADGAFQAAVGLHNASTRGSVHVIVDISGYFIQNSGHVSGAAWGAEPSVQRRGLRVAPGGHANSSNPDTWPVF
jgi:hypothetical protein